MRTLSVGGRLEFVCAIFQFLKPEKLVSILQEKKTARVQYRNFRQSVSESYYITERVRNYQKKTEIDKFFYILFGVEQESLQL